jgi:hypothetical protein
MPLLALLYRSGALPGEVEHVYDPVKSPVALRVSWLVYLGGPAHRPLSPDYQPSTK